MTYTHIKKERDTSQTISPPTKKYKEITMSYLCKEMEEFFADASECGFSKSDFERGFLLLFPSSPPCTPEFVKKHRELWDFLLMEYHFLTELINSHEKGGSESKQETERQTNEIKQNQKSLPPPQQPQQPKQQVKRRLNDSVIKDDDCSNDDENEDENDDDEENKKDKLIKTLSDENTKIKNENGKLLRRCERLEDIINSFADKLQKR